MSELITTTELCEKLKVSRNTIERYRKEGLPFKKIGKLVRFDVEEVNKWIESKK